MLSNSNYTYTCPYCFYQIDKDQTLISVNHRGDWPFLEREDLKMFQFALQFDPEEVECPPKHLFFNPKEMEVSERKRLDLAQTDSGEIRRICPQCHQEIDSAAWIKQQVFSLLLFTRSNLNNGILKDIFEKLNRSLDGFAFSKKGFSDWTGKNLEAIRIETPTRVYFYTGLHVAIDEGENYSNSLKLLLQRSVTLSNSLALVFDGLAPNQESLDAARLQFQSLYHSTLKFVKKSKLEKPIAVLFDDAQSSETNLVDISLAFSRELQSILPAVTFTNREELPTWLLSQNMLSEQH